MPHKKHARQIIDDVLYDYEHDRERHGQQENAHFDEHFIGTGFFCLSYVLYKHRCSNLHTPFNLMSFYYIIDCRHSLVKPLFPRRPAVISSKSSAHN